MCVCFFCEQKVFTIFRVIDGLYTTTAIWYIVITQNITTKRRKSWYTGTRRGGRPIKCRPIYLCRGGAQRGSRFKSAKCDICEQGAREGRRPSPYVLCSIYKDKYFTPFFIFVDKCASQDSTRKVPLQSRVRVELEYENTSTCTE